MLLSQQQKKQPLVNNKSFGNGYGSLLGGHGSSSVCSTGTATTERARWEAAAQNSFLAGILQLLYTENSRHDPRTTACHRCDIVADLYLSVLERLRVQAMNEGEMRCSRDLLELVCHMAQMLVEHAFYQEGWWFDSLAKHLWSLAKLLKDESRGADGHVTTTLGSNNPPSIIVSEPDCSVVDEQEAYRRAIRITVYNCRAHVYRQNKELDKAIVYFRKCLAVSPPLDFEAQQLLRQSAMTSLQALLIQTMNPLPANPSRRGSVSSNDSKASTSATCAHCGIEKRAMPVCAKCRAKSYCSRRCLVADKQAHNKDCRSRSHHH